MRASPSPLSRRASASVSTAPDPSERRCAAYTRPASAVGCSAGSASSKANVPGTRTSPTQLASASGAKKVPTTMAGSPSRGSSANDSCTGSDDAPGCDIQPRMSGSIQQW